MFDNRAIQLLFVFLHLSLCWADTFTNTQSGEQLHGYATGEVEDAIAIVQILEKGRLGLNLAQWRISHDAQGRKNKVAVFVIEGLIVHEIETAVFESALPKAAADGPLFILLEIDTPGGRVDLTKRICAAITAANNCHIVCYIRPGEAGGALSAGAAISLACDKLYMSANTVIGAATMITAGAQTMKKAYGEEVGEKFDSAWRATLASLAQQNGRPGLLAKAMVDSDIEVVEVKHAINGARDFIDPLNLDAMDKIVRTWSKKGSLLTLTAVEAVASGVADGIVESRAELLRNLKAGSAEIVIDEQVNLAKEELRRAEGQLRRIRKSVDLKIKKSQSPMYRGEALKILRQARSEFKTLIKLARKYPDLGLDIVPLENELNSIEAAYQNMKRQTKRR